MAGSYKAKRLLRDDDNMLELKAEGALFCVKDENVGLLVAENASGISVMAGRNGKITLCGQSQNLRNLLNAIGPHRINLAPLQTYTDKRK